MNHQSSHHDVPIWHKSFSIRSPRSVLLLNPFELTIAFLMLILTVVFTVWPELLEHSPIGFEKRGFWHHTWHYGLLFGSFMTVWGLLSGGINRLKIELIGVCLLLGGIAINLIAFLTNAFEASTLAESEVSGYDLALRLGLLFGFGVRFYTLIKEPLVQVETTATSTTESEY